MIRLSASPRDSIEDEPVSMRTAPAWRDGAACRHRGRARALVLGLVAAFGAVAPAQAASPDRYWEFADRRSAELDAFWRGDAGFYRGEAELTTRVNANMLVVHALAAREGHVGPPRADARARSIVAHLVTGPSWTELGTFGQAHAPGWTSSLAGRGVQHVSIDAQVVEGLVAAYRARGALRLTPEQSELIAARVRAVAHSPFFRWSAIRLNQWIWQADLYACDWAVSGDPRLMQEDYRAQMVRFVSSARQPSPVSTWLTEGLGCATSLTGCRGQGAIGSRRRNTAASSCPACVTTTARSSARRWCRWTPVRARSCAPSSTVSSTGSGRTPVT